MPTPTVRVEPDGHVIPVSTGETLIEAAWRQGYDWPTACYGQARCTACHVEIVSGGDHAAPATTDEVEALRMVAHRGRVLRLACRLRVTDDVIVHKRGVRPPPGTEERR